MSESNGESRTFEENIVRLEEIVSQLERGTAKLADSLALFEEGTRLAAACSASFFPLLLPLRNPAVDIIP